jgi:hypothetical protein
MLSFQKKLHTLYCIERDIVKETGFEFIRKITQISLDDKCFLFYLAFILWNIEKFEVVVSVDVIRILQTCLYCFCTYVQYNMYGEINLGNQNIPNFL